MVYKRAIEDKIKYLAEHFPVVLVTGPRQVGKTTLLKDLAEESGLNYVNLDYPMVRRSACEDPALFLQQYRPPLVIDEIQYAPELFTYIKIKVDESGENGLYYLTGSQSFKMMEGIRESLAGRIGIVRMHPMSQAEIEGRRTKPFVVEDVLQEDGSMMFKADIGNDAFERIFRGGMPKLIADRGLNENDYFSAYIQTYLERDVRDIIGLRDEGKFVKFLSCVAARTGKELNMNELSADVTVDGKTLSRWISILEGTGIVYLLKPYSSNLIKRIVKRPKLYFMDTGLACYLSYANNSKALSVSSQAGSMFETFVISEIIKSYEALGIDTRGIFHYYRDSNKREIDLIINRNGRFYPVEIKMAAEPKKDAVKNFHILHDAGLDVGKGCVISRSEIIYFLDENNAVVPYQVI